MCKNKDEIHRYHLFANLCGFACIQKRLCFFVAIENTNLLHISEALFCINLEQTVQFYYKLLS